MARRISTTDNARAPVDTRGMELERPSQNKNSNVASEFVHGFFDTAIQQPIDGVRQLFGAHVDAHAESSSSLAYKAGGLAGFILDFTALSKLTGGASNRLIGESSTGFFASEAARAATKMSIAGGIYGGVFTPSSESKGLLQGRLEGAAVSGATFATMGGAGKLIEDAKFLGGNELISRVGSNAIAGGAGGLVSTVGNTYFSEHRLASASEIASGVGQFALFGAGFGALDFGINKVSSSNVVQEKYHDLKWQMQGVSKDVKMKTYGVLNDLDMRHPISRLGTQSLARRRF